MRPPTDMAPTAWALVTRLPCEVRDRVLERSAIFITDDGLSPTDADEKALLLEAGVSVQRELLGGR